MPLKFLPASTLSRHHVRHGTSKNTFIAARATGKDSAGRHSMPGDSSPKIHNALDAFATEHEFIGVPPRHAVHTPLARDFQFIFEPMPEPVVPLRNNRGRWLRAVMLLLVLGTVVSGAYRYQSNHPIDLDAASAWASRFANTVKTAMTRTATARANARRNDPAPTDPLEASSDRTVSSTPNRAGDTRTSASDVTASDVARPPVSRPESTGTSTSVMTPVRNVSGEWRLDTQTEATDSSLQDSTLHFAMTLKQDGDRVSGVGTKFSDAQTPVTLTGIIEGDRLTLNFVETGTQPETRGKIVLLVEDSGTLRGRFSSGASLPSGHVEAHRVSAAR
jgi:hypothetical protein